MVYTDPGAARGVQENSELWALGDYPRIAAIQQPIAADLCDFLQVGPGMQVLDIATGTGNVALAAARRGADVHALDLAPHMLENVRRRARDAGVPVTLIQGDMENIPAAAESFDVALSSCGVWFARHPFGVARELRRVLRGDGRIGLANFTPDSYLGRVNEMLKQWMPSLAITPEPNMWGLEEVCRKYLSTPFRDLECRAGQLRWVFDSALDAARFLTTYSPPHVAVLKSLDSDSAQRLLDEIESFTAQFTGAVATQEIDIEYLLVRASASLCHVPSSR